MGKDGLLQFQGAGLLEALHNPLAVLGQGILLVGPVLGHVHVQAGVVFLGQSDRLLQKFITHGKRGVQSHMTLTAGGQKAVGFGQPFLPGGFAVPVGDLVTQHMSDADPVEGPGDGGQ